MRIAEWHSMNSSTLRRLNCFAPDALPTQSWDVVVIGAGVAGSLAAMLLARQGVERVLIVEAKAFPREKVCGCCLNARGQAVLQRAGVLPSVEALGGIQIEFMKLCVRQQHFVWPVPTMRATRRGSLDNLLVAHATDAGAIFADQTRATVLPDLTKSGRRQILLSSEAAAGKQNQAVVEAEFVLVADGLTQSSLKRLPEFATRVIDAAPRVGVHTFVSREQYQATQLGDCEMLTMAVAEHGYVGVAAVDGGLVDIAAAVDPRWIDKSQRPGKLINTILQECGLPTVGAFDCDGGNVSMMATPPLTRKSTSCGSTRIILLGDSLGYVEPFTGEGMSWALQTAELAIPIVLSALETSPTEVSALRSWSDRCLREWDQILKTKVVRKQWMCRKLTQLIRHPSRAVWAARACQLMPPIREWAMRQVSGR